MSFLDSYVVNSFNKTFTTLATLFGVVFLFVEIPSTAVSLGDFVVSSKSLALCLALFFFIAVYIFIWFRANKLRKISIDVDSTTVVVKAGNLFEEPGLIAIAFNEYFDTTVDNKIISERSLNGIFIKDVLGITNTSDLDSFIEDNIGESQKLDVVERPVGKAQKYVLGTACLYSDRYILTAFAKFNERNEAHLTMPEYLEFLINFWDEVNSIYAARSVSVPIFGSGITRIKEHKRITDEQLLKIMLWTFKISEMRFTHPAKLTIIVHHEKINTINLTSIKELSNGL